MELVKYDTACRALSEARSVDEVAEIKNRAEALRAYAVQARNRQLELDAIEIRTRAERRLGEMLIAAKREKAPVIRTGPNNLSLSDIGLNQHSSSKAQRLALVPQKEFDSGLAEWRQRAIKSTCAVISPFRAIRTPERVRERERVRQTDPADRLSKYRALDARLAADWQIGELSTLRAQTVLQLALIDVLVEHLPVANPDPLDTVRIVFGEGALLELFGRVRDGHIVPKRPSKVRELLRQPGDKKSRMREWRQRRAATKATMAQTLPPQG